MKLVWTQRALEDRRETFDYIKADDPVAAVIVDDSIAIATDRLIKFPDSGRPGRVEATRELVIAQTSYVAPYRVEGDIVRIFAHPSRCANLAGGTLRESFMVV